ncbi:DUF2975 domain-containing protein [uncultured Draconibacterium sp.]|uniref:DUF2975 domain-containing protein n=1 Tax=uncultured Draconibacterium sp. TaxID=1573823 RepID=UPI0029C7A190|nr:DUF2975 domain-containing protein [uncultured Draconibacterium sp.]
MKKMGKTQTEHVLIFMKILALIAYVSFAIKAIILLYFYISSIWNPESAKNFFIGLDLLQLRQENFMQYSILVASAIVLSILKSIVWWLVVQLINKIKMTNPFTGEVAYKLEKISYLLFAVWVFAVTSGGFIAWLGEKAGNLNDSWNHGQFLFMAGLVFIISQIFKRGVELQNENDLTV